MPTTKGSLSSKGLPVHSTASVHGRREFECYREAINRARVVLVAGVEFDALKQGEGGGIAGEFTEINVAVIS